MLTHAPYFPKIEPIKYRYLHTKPEGLLFSGNNKRVAATQHETATHRRTNKNKRVFCRRVYPNTSDGQNTREDILLMDLERIKDEIRRGFNCKDYLEKSKKGGYCCPFCGSGKGKNATGAVKVYNTNTFTCFSCQKSGDAIDLIQIKQGLEFMDALRYGADRLGLSLDTSKAAEHKPAPIPKPSQNRTEPTEPAEPPRQDMRPYYEKCKANITDNRAISYLTARGLSLGTAQACNLGFDEQADPAQSGHPEPRIIIPVTNCYYIGRQLHNNAPQYKAMNNKGGGTGIFNLDALERSEPIFITEGAFDAMSIIETGRNAVALNSTSNINKLLEILADKKPDTCFIAYLDNDEAGRKATPTLTQGLERLGLAHIVADIMPDIKDANEALTSDRETFIKAVEAAEQDAKAYYAEYRETMLNTPEKEIDNSKIDPIDAFLEHIQGENYKPKSTGIKWLDDVLGGGIVSKRILFLMAAPSAGKTALCQQIAENMAERGQRFIYFNWEMSTDAMLARAISRKLAEQGQFITSEEVLRGYCWTDAQRELITGAINEYRAKIAPNIKYNPNNTPAHPERLKEYLQGLAEQAKQTGTQAPAIVIDYLHLITDSSKPDIKEVIKSSVEVIRQYVEQADTIAIIISATNRETNITGKMSMSSARDSSNIEYGADYALTLNYYEVDRGTVKPDNRDEMSELKRRRLRNMLLYLDKNRFGATGIEKQIYFNAENNIFYDSVGEFIPAELFDKGGGLPFSELEKQAKAAEPTEQRQNRQGKGVII